MLSGFLARDDFDRMTVGMYHMSAPHVLDAIASAVEGNGRRSLTLTLDRKKGDDIGEGTKAQDRPEVETLSSWEHTFTDRFKWAPASISGPGKLFHSAYHIKVAVLSSRQNGQIKDCAFWLSSGNWQSSNQAPITKDVGALTFNDVKDYNREWHAVVENEQLAGVFRRHLEQDFEDNRAKADHEARVPEPPDLLLPHELAAEDSTTAHVQGVSAQIHRGQPDHHAGAHARQLRRGGHGPHQGRERERAVREPVIRSERGGRGP